MGAIRDILRGTIPAEKLRKFSGRFDVIGDIAVVTIPSGLEEYEQMIGQAILDHRHSIQTVIKKISRIAGDCRTATYDVVIGNGTETTHHENGFSYQLDLKSSFFTPRLAHERMRVTNQVQAGESVLVLFAGIGPFVIPAAARGARVVAIEQNPDACRRLVKNLQKNQVSEQVTVVQGDAFDPALLADEQFDRVIIPTPYGRDDIFDLAATRVRHNGLLHFYTFKNMTQSKEWEQEFENRGCEVISRRRCGNVAPAVSRWVFDLRRC